MIQSKKLIVLALGATILCSAGATASAHSSHHSSSSYAGHSTYAYCAQDNCWEQVSQNGDGSYTCPNGHNVNCDASSCGQYHGNGHHRGNHHE
jgi:hypothetical protein